MNAMPRLQELRRAVSQVLEDNARYASDKEPEQEEQAINDLRCGLLTLVEEKFPSGRHPASHNPEGEQGLPSPFPPDRQRYNDSDGAEDHHEHERSEWEVDDPEMGLDIPSHLLDV